MASGPIMANRWGKNGNGGRLYIFSGSKITADGDCSHEINRLLLLGRKAVTNLDSILKSRDIILPTKIPIVKAMVFSIVMWELDQKEGWEPKNWCFWTLVLKKSLEGPWDCTEIKPVNSKGNQSWIFIGRTDVESEALILWPPDAKSQLIRKDSDTGKDWRQEKKVMTEDKMVGCHDWLNRHEFEQALGDGDASEQGSLACCSLWGRRVGHNWATEQPHWITVLVFCKNRS